MEVTRLFDLLEKYRTEFIKDDALAVKRDGRWEKFSTSEYLNNAYHISYGLLEYGLEKGDRIATITNNRPEWNFIDMGMSQAGVIHVPIYPTVGEEEYHYILKHAEPKMIFVSDKTIYNKIIHIIRKISSIKKVFTFDNIQGVNHWSELAAKGKEKKDTHYGHLEEIKQGISPGDTATIIYTSGTTGVPKGVMLSHNNLVSNFKAHATIHPYGANARAISFLPLCHVFERSINYHYQYKGISIYYAENLGTIVDNMQEVKPNLFITVPRVLEKAYDKIVTKGNSLPFPKKQIFSWALKLGHSYKLEKRTLWYNIRLRIARKLVFKKWQEAFGGNVGVVVSGGAALQPRLAKIFQAAGIPVAEGYGLTETSPVIAASNFVTNEIKFGTVGPVLHNVKVKISSDGEILCKGPNVMEGYYKQPKLTEEVIDNEGWLHTGDVGKMIDNKYLKINDRKKEIFKLSSGKYIAPQMIENKFKESIFIEQLMVIGENEKFASALISPNFEYLHNWCYENKINFRDNEELIEMPDVRKLFQKEINIFNKSLGLHEQIKRFKLVCEEWGSQTGELSPTLKLKRDVVYNKYKHLIDNIYFQSKKNGVEDNSILKRIKFFKRTSQRLKHWMGF